MPARKGPKDMDLSRLPRDEMSPLQDETRENERADLRLRHDGGDGQPNFLERSRQLTMAAIGHVIDGKAGKVGRDRKEKTRVDDLHDDMVVRGFGMLACSYPIQLGVARYFGSRGFDLSSPDAGTGVVK